ncbi:uncharacterized protein LOC126899175 [Daktulosphaira vitifoliae]|uniref:uncharacterized protein LOC126899175 n=1 Tax=Daktulosphaira vitifoliae TaxID=58002 RepID=UPI0021A9BD41|nr:uncharacterized protein LOC126899175 [Daktulosphaira vitifoliae]
MFAALSVVQAATLFCKPHCLTVFCKKSFMFSLVCLILKAAHENVHASVVRATYCAFNSRLDWTSLCTLLYRTGNNDVEMVFLHGREYSGFNICISFLNSTSLTILIGCSYWFSQIIRNMGLLWTI